MKRLLMLNRLFRESAFGHRRVAVLLVTFAIGQAVLWAGAQKTTVVSTAHGTVPVETSQSPIRIAAGDLIDVQVFNTPELSAKLRVSQDGLIRLPGAGGVDVGGLTPLQAGATIEKSLRDSQIMLDPHVTVLVTEYSTQGISVLGEVKKPGTYLLLGQHSLYDALSAAGGVTQQLGSSIAITHQSDPTRPVTVPVNSPNYSELQRLTEVKAGDVVVVSRAETIYVVGDVGHPGEYFIENGQKLSVLNAIALAQGVNPTARAAKASIVRKTATGAETIPVNLNRIAKNSGENLTLRPADVLVVPRSGAKQFLNVVLPGVTGAVAGSVAAALVLR
jgi:polysaccharide biosynthesis/export protein